MSSNVPVAESDPALKKARLVAWLKEAALLVGVAAAVLIGVGALQRGGGSRAVEVDQQAPSFEVQRADGGGSVSSNDLRGKVVVLTFWATWCPACRDELPELQALHRRLGDEIAILPVSRESATTVMSYIARAGLTLPVYVGGSAFQAYAIESIPTTIVIDPKGRIVAELTGGVDAERLAELTRKAGGGGGGGGGVSN